MWEIDVAKGISPKSIPGGSIAAFFDGASKIYSNEKLAAVPDLDRDFPATQQLHSGIGVFTYYIFDQENLDIKAENINDDAKIKQVLVEFSKDPLLRRDFHHIIVTDTGVGGGGGLTSDSGPRRQRGTVISLRDAIATVKSDPALSKENEYIMALIAHEGLN